MQLLKPSCHHRIKDRQPVGGYAASAAHLIWVVGTQKIVPTLEDGMERIEEYTLPLESARARKAYGVGSSIDKLLIVNKSLCRAAPQ